MDENTVESDSTAGIDPKIIEASKLMIARARNALANDADGVLAAMRHDPIQGAVVNGVRAIRGMAEAANKAGRPMPYEVILASGIQIIKDLAGIANDKGLISDDEIQPFLKEVFQQSLQRYTAEDLQDGTLSEDDFNKVRSTLQEPAPPNMFGGA